MDADVIVIGAGAAGMMAALQAARRGRRTLLLEKNARPGLKILISGGGRCNLTTTRHGADLEAQYGKRRGRWLRHGLRQFPPAALVAMFEDAGVRLHEEDLEKIFPVSRRAADIVDALLRLLDEAGVELRREAPVAAVERDDAGAFRVRLESGETRRAAEIVIATGGLSYPRTGATGDGYRFAAALGHSLTDTFPHLAPLASDLSWVHELRGIVLQDAVLSLFGPDDRLLVRRQRPTLFTHKGLSGPGPMDLAGFVEEVGGGCTLEIDLVPDLSREALEASLQAANREAGRRHVVHLLPAALPERLRHELARQAGCEQTRAAELARDQRRALLRGLKALRLRIDRSLGFGHAEVTRGGVPLDEVDARTMASKLVPGLFLCGEVLDVDGPIGGFNFQAAFATGRLAGLAV